MKIYRVTVTRRNTGKIEFRKIYTKASSVHSCKAYWGSRVSRPAYEFLYNVTVETAYVTDWVQMNPATERMEAELDKFGAAVTAEQLRHTMLRLQAEYDTRVAQEARVAVA